MSEEFELKPCPFCGGAADSFSEDYGDDARGNNVYRAVVGCTSCGVHYEVLYHGDDLSTDADDCEDGMHCFELERMAVKAWNRRASVAEAADLVDRPTCTMAFDRVAGMVACSGCGEHFAVGAYYLDRGAWNHCPNCGAEVE